MHDAAPRALRPLLGTNALVRTTQGATLALALGIAGALWLPIDGAVIAEGRVLVEGRPQPVQSLDAGIVTRVALRNGDRVEAGQVLLELDSATARARLEIAQDRLVQALADAARLQAEAQGLREVTFGFSLPALPIALPDTAPALRHQQALFAARRQQQEDATARLAETLAQIEAQKTGLRAQLAAAREESRFLALEITRQSDLLQRGLGHQGPLGDLNRQQASLLGRIAQLESELIRLNGAARDAELAHAEGHARRAEEVAVGLRDRSAEASQILSEITSLHEALLRSELRAPVAGVVHDLSVPAAGSVVAAGVALAQILPEGRSLEIEAEIAPDDIDKLREGQEAEVMLTAFDLRNSARLGAVVTHLPPDAVRDPQTGRSFYRVTLALEPDQVPEGMVLRAGMDAQVFMKTGSRSLLDWLMAPLALPLAKALRED